MSQRLSAPQLASILAVLAAFLWATYYFFVLGVTPEVPPSALVVYPFLIGGLAYLALALWQGHGRDLVALTLDPVAYARIGLMASMQILVLAGTYVLGAVDTSLLTLVGDTVLTPLMLMAFLSEGRHRARSLLFLFGIALSTGGASLTIAGGGGAQPVQGLGWAVAILVPVVVAAYFILAARESRRRPTSAVVAHATLGAAAVVFLLSPGIPGGFSGLVVSHPVDVGLLVVLGLTSFFIAPYLYFRAIQTAGMVLPAVLMAAIPVFTLMLSAALFATIPAPLGLLGIPVAVFGAVLALRGEHPPWSPSYATGGSDPPGSPDVSRTR
ncbi:MAG: DMT family transporter [Thermoplasmata archaeon]|nr:DMT family transporter [Thermoplasmata archaeon]